MPADKESVRISGDIPTDLHRDLHEAATRVRSSVGEAVLRGIEQTAETLAPKRPARCFDFSNPLIPSRDGTPFNLTNEQLYELIEFP